MAVVTMVYFLLHFSVQMADVEGYWASRSLQWDYCPNFGIVGKPYVPILECFAIWLINCVTKTD
jgi:hypothetical protein